MLSDIFAQKFISTFYLKKHFQFYVDFLRYYFSDLFVILGYFNTHRFWRLQEVLPICIDSH